MLKGVTYARNCDHTWTVPNQRTRLVRDFDKITRKFGKRVLESHYDSELADTVLKESRLEYESLIPMIPDVTDKVHGADRYQMGTKSKTFLA